MHRVAQIGSAAALARAAGPGSVGHHPAMAETKWSPNAHESRERRRKLAVVLELVEHGKVELEPVLDSHRDETAAQAGRPAQIDAEMNSPKGEVSYLESYVALFEGIARQIVRVH